ncbi:MAG: cytidine deaminase [Planctomycetota bacterium]
MPDDQTLMQLARDVAENAHCPYSGFHVGAAIVWADGSTTVGCNVENASYPVTVCAERSAVSAGVGLGHRVIKRVAVWADVEETVSPCGACRQVLIEFAAGAAGEIEVLMGGRTDIKKTTLAVLLPDAFGA